MKDLLAELGQLVAFKKMNRDKLAESIGSTRQNLISAFKGRRPLPVSKIPSLRQALGLDDEGRFLPDRVHALTINLKKSVEKGEVFPLNFLWRFMTWPVSKKWILRGIGEGSRNGFAFVFEDARGVLIAVRNDDGLLGSALGIQDDNTEGESDEAIIARALKRANDEFEDIDKIFARAGGSPEREVPLSVFNSLFQGEISVDDLRAALNSTAKVWTWTRLREKAEKAGRNAENAARALGLGE